MYPAIVCLLATAHAADWPMFRGPNGSGVAETSGLPAQFGPSRNVAWKTAIPVGYSSPVLSARHVFVTALEENRLVTLCLDRKNGRILWRRFVDRSRSEKLHKLNHPASASPVTDGANVYVFFPDFGLVSYRADGRERWRVPLGPFQNLYGMGSSPILAGGNVVLVCDQNKESFIAAFDSETGRERWRKPRPDAVSGHSTPILFRGQILAPGSYKLDAYDSISGQPRWSFDGLPGEMKSVAVASSDTVFVHGFNTPENDPGKMIQIPAFPGRFSKDSAPTEHSKKLFAYLDLNGDGFMDEAEWAAYERTMKAENAMLAITAEGRLKWKFHRSIPQLPSPLLYRGVLYMINEGGVLTTLDPESGAVIKQARLRGVADQFYSSPIAADGKVFVTSATGVITVLEAGGEQKVLAANEMDEECMATPAIADSQIYVRTRGFLYSFQSKRD